MNEEQIKKMIEQEKAKQERRKVFFHGCVVGTITTAIILTIGHFVLLAIR